MRLEMRNLMRKYGKTVALNGLNITLDGGQILGIAGPNGAGKTTMIKILAAEETLDSGEIIINGSRAYKEKELKVAVVHQEPQLYPNFTVIENIIVGRENRWILTRKAMKQEIELLEKLGIGKYAQTELNKCPLLVHQLCEICRALLIDAEVILFDEPNSSLTENESKQLFEQMHRLKTDGKIIIFVTHRLEDLVNNSDRVIVIIDGVNAFDIDKTEMTEEYIAACLVARKRIREKDMNMHQNCSKGDNGNNKVLIDIKEYTHIQNKFSSINLQLKCGKILAIMGVEGSGGRELLRSFVGLEKATGSVQVNGNQHTNCEKLSVAYLPASRKSSLFYNYTVHENILIRLDYPVISNRIGYLKKKKMMDVAREAIVKYNITTESGFSSISSLSGGNQQKVAASAAIVKNPMLLALEEPTRGVDIHSKTEIYSFIRDYVSRGNTAAVFCTEVSEAFELADIVAVVSKGKIVKTIRVDQFETAQELAAHIAERQRKIENYKKERVYLN